MNDKKLNIASIKLKEYILKDLRLIAGLITTKGSAKGKIHLKYDSMWFSNQNLQDVLDFIKKISWIEKVFDNEIKIKDISITIRVTVD